MAELMANGSGQTLKPNGQLRHISKRAAKSQGLTLSNRFDMKTAFEIAQEDGFTLLAAAQNQAASGRGKTHLKKMTLA